MTTPGLREFRRGAVCLHILHHASQGAVHGAWMAEELAEHGHRISPGTLYPTLHRMESGGLLVSRSVVAGGKRRRVYRATPFGRKMLRDTKKALKELAAELLP
ncbi:MAG TPA: PadR family transcriptional regulator [Ilumatobacteraceae bacterium]|nr:PadR family transcriptional regulator [Ilumatobacteraceae bacterium]